MHSLGCPFWCRFQPLMKLACASGSLQCLLKSGLASACFSLLPSVRHSMEEGGHGEDPGRGWEGVGGCVSHGLSTEASRPSVLLGVTLCFPFLLPFQPCMLQGLGAYAAQGRLCPS